MPNAAARYVITADDKTAGAIASVKRGFADLDKNARKLSQGLKGIGVGALALKAWGITARAGDEAIRNLADSNAQFAASLRETAAALKDVWTAGQRTIETQKTLATILKDPAVQDSVSGLADRFGQLRLEIKALLPAWALLLHHGTDTKRVFDELANVKPVGPQSRGSVRDLGDVDAARKLGTSQNKAFDDLAKATASGVVEALKRDVQAAKDAAAALDEYAKGLVRAHEIGRELSKTGLLSIDPQQFEDTRFDQFGESLIESTEGIADRMGEALKEPFIELTPYAEQAARNMQDTFADFLFDPFQDGMKGMLKGFIDVIRRMVAEAAAAQIFGSKASGGLGFADFITGAVGGVFGGGKAAGGPVAAGTSYLVGERGPELFTPRSSGHITPNGAGGDVVQNITYNVDARGASTELMTVLPEALQRTSDMTVARVRDLIRRGRL